MENIKFIKEIASRGSMSFHTLGNVIFYEMDNGNRAKAWCESSEVEVEIINPVYGKVDKISLPFRQYFAPTQCSKGSPRWWQHIEITTNGDARWRFENQYPHTRPTDEDFRALAEAIEGYVRLFDVEFE